MDHLTLYVYKKKLLNTSLTIYFHVLLFFLSVLFINVINASSSSLAPSYRKQEITPENFTVETEIDKEIVITGFKNVKNVIAIKPEIASTQIISNQEISIKGIKLGNTFIHIWDDDGLMTIKVYVKRKGFEEAQVIAERRRQKEMGEPIRIGYLYDFSKWHSDYDNRDLEWKTQEDRHRFTLSGDTPYGYFDGALSYFFRKDQSGKTDDVKSWDFEFKNKFFKLLGGDIYTSFSDITMPRTHIQGIQLSSGSGLTGDKFKYDIIMGSTGYYLWGSRLSSFGQVEHRFYGLRAEVSPQKDLSFFTTLMDSAYETTENTRNIARRLGSIGLKYTIEKYLTFDIETAKNNKNRTALSSSIKLNIDKLNTDITFKDITVDYLNMTGNTMGRGRRGIYTKVMFQPLDILFLSTNFDVYQNRLTPDPDSVEKGNKDFSFISRLRCPPTKTDFSISYSHRDNRGQEFPLVTMDQEYKVTQWLNDIFLLGNIRGDVSYKTSRYKSFITGESNYIDKTLRGSVTIRPIRGLSFMVQEILNYREWTVRDYSTSPRRFYARASYNTQVGKLPIWINTSLGYQIDSHVNQDKISRILGEDALIFESGLKLQVLPGLNAFLDVRLKKIKGSVNPALDRVMTYTYGGIKFDWDTPVTLEGYGTIKGYVFKDVNKNGMMDRDDSPMKGVKILIDGKKKVVTNKHGFYRIRYIKTSSRNISVDPTSIPKDYISTTPLNVRIDIEKMDVKEVKFGLAPKANIKGFVFNDLNRNKTFDEKDKPMRNVLIKLDDGETAFTRSHGHFMLRNVALGKRTISVDMNTVPTDLLQEPPMVRTLLIEEGTEKEVQFIFYALRFIAGTVYIDYNSNNKVDENEAVGGVKLVCENKTAITDEDGRYIFRDLPAGKVRIVIDKSSIPSNTILEKDIIEVNLKDESDPRRNFNIRLLQKT